MNQLRQLMLEELQRRNFAATTIRTYLHGVSHFSRYFRRSPDQLGPEDIRKYQAMLFAKLKFSPNTVILRLAALRFFYIHVLKRNWSIAETPYPKKVRHLPGVLSQEEVARLIDAADTPFHRILLMTMYATGARRAEAAHLKVSDIDSQRMVVHIREGKGGKDRDMMLSPRLLEELRVYWRGLRRKPREWLFPGPRVAQPDLMFLAELFMKVAHVQIEVPVPVETKNLVGLLLGHSSAAWLPSSPVQQALVAFFLIALPPSSQLPLADAD